MCYSQVDQSSAEWEECLSWMSDSRNVNCSQSTTTRWPVSNERQHGGVGADFVLHPLIHTFAPETSTQDLEKKKVEPRTPHFLSLNQDIVASSK